MRYLGVDYGTKRVGIAVSDEGGTLAFPYAILDNNKTLLGKVEDICSRESIETIVVGESVDYKGNPNVVMKEIEQFIVELRARVAVPIVTEREFLTTQQARFFQQEKERVDDSAAAIILQSYLDRKNNTSMRETLE
jgi:putative Holliday junction resolvase